MFNSYIIATLFALLLAVATFFALQKSLIQFTIKQSIALPLEEVFSIAKNPQYLVHLHSKVRDINITNYTSEGGVERWEFLVTEDLPHVGHHTFPAITTANSSQFQIASHAAPMYGLMYVKTKWTIEEGRGESDEADDDDYDADIEDEDQQPVHTLITEDFKLYAPWIIQEYCNRTAWEYHTQLLLNLKIVLEEGLHKHWET